MQAGKIRLFSTARTDVYVLTEDFAPALEFFLLKNKDNFAPYEPLRSPEFYTRKNITQRIADVWPDYQAKKCLLLVFTLTGKDEVVGSVNFTNFVYGVFQAGYLGFSLDLHHEGQGLMSEVIAAALPWIRQHYGLHRIMANHLPDNERSKKTLSRLGFMQEGFARSYLKINGKWQDHVLNSYVFEN
ncbi:MULTISPECIES: GNAT family N-acetyltransferase [Photorhabdus]|uniref:GNAT family N-acetyltransferase n=1 Tax=Photorhabdus kayaii TaxID=230088 RepID=A0ABX0B605_9GAMM|nr:MULTISPECIES: GNAT family N-acetyltransferase [Photorhabdus]MCC8374508.1 GNAT family N-acetyltransferase [Photorhabdus bodei]MCT8354342.1 GNAT family N-acetyltransferase [Photorhabdus kayaii]MDB6368620.1 GNAT family N-acetyltransferase [Photorhabdus bodei]NDL12466.1 GNAT family N-acetyltransferase [Photorhabdus kayaii]NDL26036.1 GNAT family N-acetyltransferase [Photorhabdus kayaii]